MSAIFDAYVLKKFPARLSGRKNLLSFAVAEAHQVETRPEKTARVFSALERKLSAAGLRRLMLVWLSEEEGCDRLLFHYLCRVLESSAGRMENDLGDARVLEVRRLARKVSRQAERCAGLARFQKTRQGVYLAILEPRHNILPLLKEHFAGRFADQPWGIYDAGRRYGLLRDAESFKEFFMDESLLCNGSLREDLLAEEEKALRALWKGYFEACAVRERLNPRLQQRCMPKKYWKYLTEKQPDFNNPPLPESEFHYAGD